MKLSRFSLVLFSTIMVLLAGCASQNPTDNSINLFSIEDDIALGKQLDDEIRSNPAEYPILSESQYSSAYNYLRGIRDKILAGGFVYYKDKFPWKITIINDPKTLNAFATPGGYIYVYSGLIKFLDTEDQLAGVLGHEMAHADRRHSTDALTKQYGIAILLELALGNNQGLLSDIAAALVSLKFSRSAEEEADKYSVVYLCPTNYNAAGAAGFFEKMEAAGGSQPPEFLSTHPNPGDRIQAIKAKKAEYKCSGTAKNPTEYQQFKNSIPG